MAMGKLEFLASCGVERQTLEIWIEQQWLLPEATSSGEVFSDRDAARVRLIQDLQGRFGVNDEGIDLILHLVDQLHGMRRALAELQHSLRET